MEKNKRIFYNILFLALCGGILLFLLQAPEETTARLPDDETHLKFHSMGKKEAEKFCEECHNPGGDSPLPESHPPPYRCLFCHKQKTEIRGQKTENQ